MEAEEREKKALYVIPEEPEPEIEEEEEENTNGYSKIFFFPFLGSPDRYVPDCK
jgi:hypothetical protein